MNVQIQIQSLPPSIQNLVQRIIQDLEPEKIILFGSRARGDNRENSDFDLACVFKNKNQQKWTQFVVDLQEEIITLWPIDLVDYSELNDEYKKNILAEGIILYERNP